MTERLDLVVLPAIAGHTHALGADGQPTCGCVPRVAAFMLTAAIPVETFYAKTHKFHCRVEYPPHVCTCVERVKFSSKCDVGADIPGGGAA